MPAWSCTLALRCEPPQVGRSVDASLDREYPGRMIATRRMVSCIALAMLFGLGACSDDEGTPPDAAPLTSTSRPASPDASADVLPDGEHYGFFTKFEPSSNPGGYDVSFDVVMYDPDAEDTRRVVNDSTEAVQVVLSPDVIVSISHLNDTNVASGSERVDSELVTLDAFYERNRAAIPGSDPALTAPFIRLTIADGLVTKIDEVFES